jgi:SAM-dependent methyltransferase
VQEGGLRYVQECGTRTKTPLPGGRTGMRRQPVADVLLRSIGWIATVLSGDSTVWDRWIWLRRHLMRGPARTLDAGCGSGAFTMYAAKVGNDAVGMSFNEAQVHRAQHRAETLSISNVEFVVGDLRHLDELGSDLGQFDQVLCFETIEHIPDDEKLVRDLAGLLKPGGRILVTTPFEGRRPWWGDPEVEEEDGGHVRWGYSHDELRALLGAHGITVVAAESICGCISRLLVNASRMLSGLGYRVAWALVFPLRPLLIIDRPLTKALRHPFSCIAVVGVRDDTNGTNGQDG